MRGKRHACICTEPNWNDSKPDWFWFLSVSVERTERGPTQTLTKHNITNSLFVKSLFNYDSISSTTLPTGVFHPPSFHSSLARTLRIGSRSATSRAFPAPPRSGRRPATGIWCPSRPETRRWPCVLAARFPCSQWLSPFGARPSGTGTSAVRIPNNRNYLVNIYVYSTRQYAQRKSF